MLSDDMLSLLLGELIVCKVNTQWKDLPVSHRVLDQKKVWARIAIKMAKDGLINCN